MTEGKAFGTK